MKKIIALIVALMVIVNISVIKTFAVMAAPVAAEGFADVLIALLLGAGHSQSEIDGMSVTEMQDVVTNDFNIGRLNLDTTITDPVTGACLDFLDYVNNPQNKAAIDIYRRATSDFITKALVGSDYYWDLTSTTDFPDGCGAFYTYVDVNSGFKYKIPCDYIIVNSDGEIFSCYSNQGYKSFPIYCDRGNGFYKENYVTGFSETGSSRWFSNFVNVTLHGDVRYETGEQYPTDDEYQYQVGTLPDGTVVTPDVINPDGTVTVDGVTYYPVDYIDPSKLNDTGKRQFVNNITNVINNTYVISDDKPVVDDKDITVNVPDELSDYAVPVGIANVFPFCIPWDIVHGFQLLCRPAVTPKFEIPFTIPEFGFFPGVEETITLDFSEYDKYIQVFRWFQIIGFSFLLCSLSFKRVKGV